jgi:hypothetical protein
LNGGRFEMAFRPLDQRSRRLKVPEAHTIEGLAERAFKGLESNFSARSSLNYLSLSNRVMSRRNYVA